MKIIIIITITLFFSFSNNVKSQDLIENTKLGIYESNENQDGTRIYNEIQEYIDQPTNRIDKLFEINNNDNYLEIEDDFLSRKPVYLYLNRSELQQIHKANEAIFELKIPVDSDHSFRLILKEFSITSEGFDASTKEGASIDHTQIKTFRGYIEGLPKSTVSMTISNENVSVLISDDNANYSLGRYDQSLSEYVLLNDNSLLDKHDFNCGSDDLIMDGLEDGDAGLEKSSTIGCLDVFLEVGNDIYTANGGTEQTLFFVMSMFNQSATIFCNENIDINISDAIIWTTTDPYNSLSTMSAVLDAFATNTQNSFDGDLAHLLIGGIRGNVGGLAWIDVIGASYNPSCPTNNGTHPCGPYGVSGQMNSSLNTYPTYSTSVSTFAHELGHNFGSRHTHSCVWNGNNTAIDGCATPSGCPNPGPTSNGTIMSYCSGYSLANGFGPQPGGLIRSRLSSAINSNLIDGNCSCSVPCPEDFVLASYGVAYPFSWSFQSPRMFGDVNGDGKDDVVGFASAGLRIALSTGSDIVYNSSWNLPSFGASSGGWNTNNNPRFIIDVNGDGKDDVVGFGNAAVFVSTSTGSNFNNMTNWINGFGISNGFTVTDHPRLPCDFNNDNKTDFLAFGNIEVLSLESTGTEFVRNTAFDIAQYGVQNGWTLNRPRLIGDVDGDGYDDDVVGFAASIVLVTQSDGTTFGTPTGWTTNFTESEGWSVNLHLRMLADVNGDGKDDIVGFASEGVRVGISTGNSFLPQQLWKSTFGINNGWTVANHPRFMADVNGDGMDDIVGFGNLGVFVSLSTGTGFGPSTLLQSCYGFHQGWSDIDNVRSHADFSGNGSQEIVAMGCGGTYIHFSKNDDCSSARTLSVSTACNPSTGSNNNFSSSGELPAFSCGNTGTTIDMWYKVVIPLSGNLNIETTQVTGGLTDMVMQVLAGSCGSFTEIDCNDDGGSGNHSLITITGRTPDEIIYIRVVEFASNQFGEFGICAHDDTVVSNCPPNYSGANQLSGTQATTEDFETDGILQSDQIVDADVDYDSGTYIELLEGFEVKIGKLFHAFIDGCGNLFRDDNEDSSNKTQSK